MARGDERKWTEQEVVDEYRRHGGPRVASRVSEVMERVDGLGRLHFGPGTQTPAFGIIGDRGKQILSIREHPGQPLQARVSIFLGPERWASPGQREEVRSRLREIAKPNADFDRHGSVDAMHLATCSDEEFAGLLALLDWLGPLPAAETSAAI